MVFYFILSRLTQAIFKGRAVRKTLHNGEWLFSVMDVVGTLTDNVDLGAYWRKLKGRLREEGSELVTNCHGLKLSATNGNRFPTEAFGNDSLSKILPNARQNDVYINPPAAPTYKTPVQSHLT